MDDIFPFLMVLFAIGSGLASFFGKDKKDDDSTKKTVSTKPVNRQHQTQAKKSVNEASSQKTSSMGSYFEERKEQIEALQSSLDTDPNRSNDVSQNRMQEVIELKRKKKQKPARKTSMSLARNISKEGLAESVIMAEVLGAPRAKRPYQSRIYTRK